MHARTHAHHCPIFSRTLQHHQLVRNGHYHSRATQMKFESSTNEVRNLQESQEYRWQYRIRLYNTKSQYNSVYVCVCVWERGGGYTSNLDGYVWYYNSVHKYYTWTSHFSTKSESSYLWCKSINIAHQNFIVCANDYYRHKKTEYIKRSTTKWNTRTHPPRTHKHTLKIHSIYRIDYGMTEYPDDW